MKIIFNQFGDGIKIIKFSCHYHVILLFIATVRSDILCNGMIYYMFCINSQLLCHVINVYINSQMTILIINVNINAIFLGLLSIMLVVITSLHREFGVEGDGCTTMWYVMPCDCVTCIWICGMWNTCKCCC